MSDVLSDWSDADQKHLAVLLPRLVDGLRQVAYRSDNSESDTSEQARSA
jgi:hypothetical protein